MRKVLWNGVWEAARVLNRTSYNNEVRPPICALRPSIYILRTVPLVLTAPRSPTGHTSWWTGIAYGILSCFDTAKPSKDRIVAAEGPRKRLEDKAADGLLRWNAIR